MAPDKLVPNDPRAPSHKATVRGKTYRYLLAKPSGPPADTILLCHGFPDLSLGWRYQVPMLLSLGLQVIVPDMLGFGETDAPEEVEPYSFKSVSDDLAELVEQVVGPGKQIILGGHDWGGALVWRMVLWHPELIRAVFSVCTPYSPPSAHPAVADLREVVKRLPNFRYQLQFAGEEIAREVRGPSRVRAFLTGMYAGRGTAADGSPIYPFTTERGFDVGMLEEGKLGPSPLVSPEEMDYYVAQYAPRGLRGPTNWYRTRKVNYDEELALLKGGDAPPRIATPSLMVTASNDIALPASMTDGMPPHFDNLTRRGAQGNHWVLWQSSEEVNGHLKEFIEGVLKGKGDAPKASI